MGRCLRTAKGRLFMKGKVKLFIYGDKKEERSGHQVTSRSQAQGEVASGEKRV